MYQVLAKPPNVVVLIFIPYDTICEAAYVTMSEEEVSSPLHLVRSIIIPPTHTADVLVSVHCVVIKVITVLVVTSGRL